MKWSRRTLGWAKFIIFGMLLAMFFRAFFFTTYVVEGKSMMPTLQNGNFLVVNKIGYRLGALHRFDVIVFHANDKEDYVKRVIGLPGDRLEYKNDRLYINGAYVEEPYLDRHRKDGEGEFTSDFELSYVTDYPVVPKGKVFVIGDNRRNSWDSRHFGFVDMKQVVGRVDVRYWPGSKWGDF